MFRNSWIYAAKATKNSADMTDSPAFNEISQEDGYLPMPDAQVPEVGLTPAVPSDPRRRLLRQRLQPRA